MIAINGQTGETVTAAGIRSYASQSQASGSQSPPFSLLPEGPAANVKTSSTAVRAAHDRAAHLEQLAGHRAGPGERDPAGPRGPGGDGRGARPVGLTGVRGTIQQVSPTPVSTSIGTAYQAIVRISGHQRVTPLGGMTANVQLAS